MLLFIRRVLVVSFLMFLCIVLFRMIAPSQYNQVKDYLHGETTQHISTIDNKNDGNNRDNHDIKTEDTNLDNRENQEKGENNQNYHNEYQDNNQDSENDYQKDTISKDEAKNIEQVIAEIDKIIDKNNATLKVKNKKEENKLENKKEETIKRDNDIREEKQDKENKEENIDKTNKHTEENSKPQSNQISDDTLHTEEDDQKEESWIEKVDKEIAQTPEGKMLEGIIDGKVLAPQLQQIQKSNIQSHNKSVDQKVEIYINNNAKNYTTITEKEARNQYKHKENSGGLSEYDKAMTEYIFEDITID